MNKISFLVFIASAVFLHDCSASCLEFSPTNVSIVVWGRSGAGVSSTVKSLIGGRTPSITTGNVSLDSLITEHLFQTIPAQPSNYLKLIDVAGLVSRNSSEMDARAMSALHDHILSSGYLPNYYLLVSNFEDKEFQDRNSEFNKMIRKISKLQESLAANCNSTRGGNNIILFSKLMKENSLLQKRPEVKTSLFRATLAKYSPDLKLVSRKVYLGENKGTEYGLEQVEGFTKLPSGDSYPKNILDRMISSGGNSGFNLSPTGVQLIQSFANRNLVFPYTKVIILASNSPPKNGFLTFVEAQEEGIGENEISQKLQQSFESMATSVNPLEQENARKVLIHVQKFMQSSSINKVEQLPKSDVDRGLFFYKMIESFPRDAKAAFAFEFLKKAFELIPPISPKKGSNGNFTLVVLGKGRSGITTTVGKLLGPAATIKIVARPGRQFSSEAYVTQYSIVLPASGGLFKLVDVEGLVEGKSAEHDEKVMNSLAKYIADCDAGLCGSIPSAFLIVSNFDDSDFLGRESSLLQVANKIKNLQTSFGTENFNASNNVLLLTKLLSEISSNQKSPEAKCSLFQESLEELLSPVFKLADSPLLGENILSQNKLSQEGQYIELSNGQLYPKNVIEKLYAIANRNEEMGDKIILNNFINLRNSLMAFDAHSVGY